MTSVIRIMLPPCRWCFAQMDLPDIWQSCQQDVSKLKMSAQLACRHCHNDRGCTPGQPSDFLDMSKSHSQAVLLISWSCWSGRACEVAGYAAPTRQLREQLRARERQCERASPDIAAAAPLSTAPRLCPLQPGMVLYNVGLPTLPFSPP